MEEGFNLKLIKNDSIFYIDAKEQIYKELTHQDYQNILEKKLKF
jgi:hypothetical protein